MALPEALPGVSGCAVIRFRCRLCAGARLCLGFASLHPFLPQLQSRAFPPLSYVQGSFCLSSKNGCGGGAIPSGEYLIKTKPKSPPPPLQPRHSSFVEEGPLRAFLGPGLSVPGTPSTCAQRSAPRGSPTATSGPGPSGLGEAAAAPATSASPYPRCFQEAPAIHGEAPIHPDCHHPADKRPDPRRQGGSYSWLIIAESREQAKGGG